MKQAFHDFILRRVPNPTEQEVNEILAAFTPKNFAKGDLFKEKDTVINQLGFLESGSARSFFLNQKGSEITDEIISKDNFLSDIISVRTQKKSPIVIELLEDSQAVITTMTKARELLAKNLTFNILIREYIGDRAMNLVKRHLLFLNGTATERYEYLIATNPTLLQKYPLRFVASMIGVTQTQLSRIRKKKE